MAIFKTSAHLFEDFNLSFSALDYSKMKFGDIESSKKCALDLSKVFIEFLKNNEITKKIVVAPSPYQEIPKSSHHIFTFFVKYVNRWLFQNNKEMLITTKIGSSHVYNVDYGTLLLEDREKLIKTGVLQVDRDLIFNSHFVMLDDLRMTGTLEKTIINRLQNQKILETFDFHLVYYAENTSTIIPDNFENYLNFAAIKTYHDFIEILDLGGMWNMRNLKYVLELDEKCLLDFLTIMNEKTNGIFIENFYDTVISSNCYSVETYKKNILNIQNYFVNLLKKSYIF